jgi:hypothetical protein
MCHPDAVTRSIQARPAVHRFAGAILATASEDWAVGLWRLEPVEAIRRLCAMLTPSANATGQALPAACD